MGVADLYGVTAAAADASAASAARALASAVAMPALRLAARDAVADPAAGATPLPKLRRQVQQATGMVMAQLVTRLVG